MKKLILAVLLFLALVPTAHSQVVVTIPPVYTTVYQYPLYPPQPVYYPPVYLGPVYAPAPVYSPVYSPVYTPLYPAYPTTWLYTVPQVRVQIRVR